jgi:hypothetical protein
MHSLRSAVRNISHNLDCGASAISAITESLQCEPRPWEAIPTNDRAKPSSFRTPKNLQSKRRRVHFFVDENDCVWPDLVVGQAPISMDKAARLWWSPQELDEILQYTRYTAEFHRVVRPEFSELVAELFGACLKSNANEIAVRINTAVTAIVNSVARGLELAVAPQLSHRRRYCIDEVLKTQKRLNHWPSDRRIRILAKQYQRNGKYAHIMARVLADGDALEIL